MTDARALGQLFMVGFDGTSVSPAFASWLKTYQPGGVILFRRNLTDADQIVSLTNALQTHVETPLLIAIDQEGGRVSRLPDGFTIFPPCARLGGCDSTDLAYEAAAATARELQAVGINMNMAPVLDVDTNPANPIIGDRAFGKDPDVVGRFGVATMRGLHAHGVISCGKHFPGHGDTSADSHKELPIVEAGEARLRDIELRPFRLAIAEGLPTLMTAHVVYPALDPANPATLSSRILTELLRTELGFDGVTITDDLEMNAIVDHGGIDDAAVAACQAGADVLLICHQMDRQTAAIEALRRAVDRGQIAAARLAASLRRVAELKQRFLAAYRPADAKTARGIVGSPAHRALVARVERGGASSVRSA
jgi:beta-N-acetylhexosaminidase